MAGRNAVPAEPRVGALQTSPVEVHTDVLELSLHRIGDGPSHKVLKIIASIVNLRRFRTHFLLAAHPYFLPDDQCPDLGALEQDKEYTRFLARRWEGLETVLDDRDLVKDGKIAKDPPTHGYDGYLLRSPYAEVAHFLTVDKMLSRFPRRHYYMDGDRAQYQGGPGRDASQIRDSRRYCTLQHRRSRAPGGATAPRSSSRRPRGDKPRLRQFSGGEAVGKVGGSSGRDEEHGEPLAMAKSGGVRFRGARTRKELGWLQYPPTARVICGCGRLADAKRRRSRRRVRALAERQLQAVTQIRLHALAHQLCESPPDSTSGRRYVSSSKDPRSVCAEFSIYLFLRNYFRRPAAEEKHIRAEAMGLIPSGRPVLSPEEAVWSFRLGLKHARKMVQWLRSP